MGHGAVCRALVVTRVGRARRLANKRNTGSQATSWTIQHRKRPFANCLHVSRPTPRRAVPSAPHTFSPLTDEVTEAEGAGKERAPAPRGDGVRSQSRTAGHPQARAVTGSERAATSLRWTTHLSPRLVPLDLCPALSPFIPAA